MRVLRAARRFLGLGSTDQLFLARAFIALALVELRCRLLGFQRVVDSCAPSRTGRVPTREELRRARRYAGWLEIAGRHHFIRARCLHQSLALHGWLTAEGLPAELRIGVRTVNQALLAHAWVELGGQVVNDRPEAVSEFTPFARLPVAPRPGGSAASRDRARDATVGAVGGS